MNFLSWFPNGFPGLTAAMSRLLERKVLPQEMASDVIVEAINAIAKRLDTLEVKVEEILEHGAEDPS